MPYRKVPLVKKEIYHVFNKSIAGFRIFNNHKEYQRMLDCIVYYTIKNPPYRFSLFEEKRNKNNNEDDFIDIKKSKKIVKILAYCIMPTHFHLILQQLSDRGISMYINLISKSHSKYFNVKYHRKGPLWESRFKNILIETDEQLLHLTRYIHLNPYAADVIDNPAKWKYSSYKEYIHIMDENERICAFNDHLNIDSTYEKFVSDRAGYRRELHKIKHMILE